MPWGRTRCGSQLATDADPEEEIEEPHVEQVVREMGSTKAQTVLRRGLLPEGEVGRQPVVDEEAEDIADGS